MATVKKLRPALGPLRFKGSISLRSNIATAAFKILIDPSGELKVDVAPIRINKATRFLLDSIGTKSKFQHYVLSGTSTPTRRLTSDSLYFTKTVYKPGRLKLSGKCVRAVITSPIKKYQEKPVYQAFIRGFKSFDLLSAPTQFGLLSIGGNINTKSNKELSGRATVQAEESGAPIVTWKKQVTKCVDKVLFLMSFASGTLITRPVSEVFYQRRVETEVENQSVHLSTGLAPFSELNMNPFFQCTIRNIEGNPERVEELIFAIRWMLIPETYNELRILKGLVAVENVLNSALSVSETKILSPLDFRKVAAALSDRLHELKEYEAKRNSLADKLKLLNQLTLEEKIQCLISKWGIPISNMPVGFVKDLVEARNRIAHKGEYYKNRDPSQKELWHHVLMLNEFLVRAILTRMNFVGNYMSYLGGYHQRSFPDCVKT